eukprot:g3266.t1
MAGERAQAATARALASLGVDADLGGASPALDVGLCLGGAGGRGRGREERGRGGGGRRRRREEWKRGPISPSSSSSSPPSPSPPSPSDAARLSPRGAASGEASATAASTPRPVPQGSGAASDGTPDSVPQGQRQPSVLLQGAQAQAARRALALNLKLQGALRQELRGVEDTLQRNREILVAAEARLSSKRCVGITTSSDKFLWSRAVQKFLQVGAHPGKNPGLHKEQETILRRGDQAPWRTAEVEALSKYIAKNHPEVMDPQTAHQSHPVDWEKAAVFVDKNPRRNNKRDRVHCMRTGEECRLRWMHVGVFGAEADAPWTKEEDLAVMMQAEQRGAREWVKIAEEVQKVNGGVRRRTPIACLRRYQATLNTNFLRWSKWTDEEDRILHAAVKCYGPKNWLMVARDLPGRSPAQCENKFKHTRRANGVGSAAMMNLALYRDRLLRRCKGSKPEASADDDAPSQADGGNLDQDPQQQQQQQQEKNKRQRRQQQQPQQSQNAEKRPDDQDFWGPTQPTRSGLWTPTEERRLCMAVRALMPQGTEFNKGKDRPLPSEPAAATAGAAAAGGRVEAGATASGAGTTKKRPRDTAEASPNDGPGAPHSAVGEGGCAREEEKGEGEGAGRKNRCRAREATNALEHLSGVHWGEVAALMAYTRNEGQCRVKWFEVMDPSVNRSRVWEPEEDAQLLKIMKVRKIGAWRAAERDMADFAQERGILRRTDHSCRRRFAHLEPEKYEQHKRDARDRKGVVPRLNAPSSADYGGKTEITFEDFDLVEESSEEDDDEAEGDDGDDDDDIGW